MDPHHNHDPSSCESRKIKFTGHAPKCLLVLNNGYASCAPVGSGYFPLNLCIFPSTRFQEKGFNSQAFAELTAWHRHTCSCRNVLARKRRSLEASKGGGEQNVTKALMENFRGFKASYEMSLMLLFDLRRTVIVDSMFNGISNSQGPGWDYSCRFSLALCTSGALTQLEEPIETAKSNILQSPLRNLCNSLEKPCHCLSLAKTPGSKHIPTDHQRPRILQCK